MAVDYSKLDPELLAKMAEIEAKSPANRTAALVGETVKQLAALREDLANIQSPDLSKALTPILTSLESLQSVLKPQPRESYTPELKKLSTGLQRVIEAIKQIELKPPTVKVDAPQVNVPPVDISKLEQLLDKQLPSLLSKLIKSIPQPETTDLSGTEKLLREANKTLGEIRDRPIPIPQMPTTLKVTNPDGSVISGGGGGGGDGAITDGSSSSIKATVLDYTGSNPLAVRLTDENGDYIAPSGGAGGSGTEYTEDAAAAANPVGPMSMARRKDTLSGTEVSADGDNIALNASSKGELYVKHTDSIPVTGTFYQATQPVSGTVAVSNATFPVTDNGGSLTVDGTVGVSGTVTVDGSGVTQPISHAALTELAAAINSDKLDVNIASGSSAGTQYTEGDTDSTITGTAVLWEDASDTLRAVSATKPLPTSSTQSGTWNIGTLATITNPVAATQSGTWNITNVSGTVSLPTGAATSAKQDTGNTSLGTIAGAVSGTEMQVDVLTMPTTTVQATNLDIRDLSSASDSVAITDGGGSITVDGTFWQATQPVSGTVTANLAAGTNNIGDVDVLTLPVAFNTGVRSATTQRVTVATDDVVQVADNGGSLTVDGTVGISGTVPVSGTFWQATQPVSGTVTANAGTGTFIVAGTAAQDAAISGNPVNNGYRASAAEPTAMSADGDVVYGWADRKGRQVITQQAGTATLSNVAGSASSVTVLAANTSRQGATVVNDSTAICYLKMGSAASTTSYTVKMQPEAYYEVPFGYTGILTGIWASATGSARVTEIT